MPFLFERAAILARFVNPTDADLMLNMTHSTFKELFGVFETYLRATCAALLPDHQPPHRNIVNALLDTLGDELGRPLLNLQEKQAVDAIRRRRNALTHPKSAPRPDVSPDLDPNPAEPFDRLPPEHQQVVQEIAVFLSIITHIEVQLQQLPPARLSASHDPAYSPADSVQRMFDSLDLTLDELARLPNVLRLLRRALPDGWTLPLPVSMEHIAVVVYLWAQANPTAETSSCIDGLKIALLPTSSGEMELSFALNRDVDLMRGATLTHEDDWGVLWLPDGRAPFWLWDALPEEVARHFFSTPVTISAMTPDSSDA